MNNIIKEKLALYAVEQILDIIMDSQLIGIGSGSTVDEVINNLPKQVQSIPVVCASQASESLLNKKGFKTVDFAQNADSRVDIYIDGADTFDDNFVLLKGRGKAMTREKILAHGADIFICVATGDKAVQDLNANNAFPHDRIMLEVVPNLTDFVQHRIFNELGGKFGAHLGLSDNGCEVFEVLNLDLSDAAHMERSLVRIEGVVESGIFALDQPNIIITQASHSPEAEFVTLNR